MKNGGLKLLGALTFLGALSLGCDAPTIVDCSPGHFVRTSEGPWCVLPDSATARCPSVLPAEHTLPWGGRGCAEIEHDTLPHELCVNAGVCDGGTTGDAGS